MSAFLWAPPSHSDANIISGRSLTFRLLQVFMKSPSRNKENAISRNLSAQIRLCNYGYIVSETGWIDIAAIRLAAFPLTSAPCGGRMYTKRVHTKSVNKCPATSIFSLFLSRPPRRFVFRAYASICLAALDLPKKVE